MIPDSILRRSRSPHIDARPRQRLRLEVNSASSPRLQEPPRHPTVQANNSVSNLPVPSSRPIAAPARRDPAAFSRARRLERFRARRQAIAESNYAEEYDDEEEEENEGRNALLATQNQDRPATEDIATRTAAGQLSEPVKKARKILMVSFAIAIG
jgi:hypothetical protein